MFLYLYFEKQSGGNRILNSSLIFSPCPTYCRAIKESVSTDNFRELIPSKCVLSKLRLFFNEKLSRRRENKSPTLFDLKVSCVCVPMFRDYQSAVSSPVLVFFSTLSAIDAVFLSSLSIHLIVGVCLCVILTMSRLSIK